MRQYLLSLLLLFIPFTLTHAFGVGQVYAGQGICTQTSTTNFTCMDGRPIVIGISLTAQQYPYYFYGNFTALAPVNSKYGDPVSVYGTPCTVPSGKTSICFVTLPAIPATALNGTLSENISLVLQSQQYPQEMLNESFNVMITHYANNDERFAFALYNATLGQYNQTNSQYSYFCASYSVCNGTIGSALSNASSYLANATNDFNSNYLAEAYLNATKANQSLSAIKPEIAPFISKANIIVNDNFKARGIVLNATANYNQNYKKLYSCNPTYTKRMNATLSELVSAPMVQTVNASAAYLALANSTRDNVTSEINRCSGSSSASGGSLAVSIGNLLPGKGSQVPLGYFLILPTLIIILYLAVRLREAREVKRLRDEANKHDKSKQQNGGTVDGGNPLVTQKEENGAGPDPAEKPK